MRTWPASTSAAALVRAFTSRACQSHLSRRWRSTQHPGVFLMRTGTQPRIKSEGMLRLKTPLYSDAFSSREPVPTSLENAIYGSLRLPVSCSLSAASLANGELGSIGRSRSRGPALDAYCRCDGPLSRAFVASAVFAIAELALVPVSAVSLAIDAIARPALPVIARFSCRHAINSGRGYDSAIRRRLSRTRVAEIAVTFAPPMTFAFGAVACFASRSFAGGSRLRAFGSAIGATVPVAVMARRTPLLRPATGTPDLDQFGLCGCCGCLGRGGDITAYCFNSRFRRSQFDWRFGNNGWRHSLGIVNLFRFRLGDGCSVIGRRFGSIRCLREIDRGQQRRRSRV